MSQLARFRRLTGATRSGRDGKNLRGKGSSVTGHVAVRRALDPATGTPRYPGEPSPKYESHDAVLVGNILFELIVVSVIKEKTAPHVAYRAVPLNRISRRIFTNNKANENDVVGFFLESSSSYEMTIANGNGRVGFLRLLFFSYSFNPSLYQQTNAPLRALSQRIKG